MHLAAAAASALLLLPFAAAAGAAHTGATTRTSALPPNHPPSHQHLELVRQFAGTLQCPYAAEWLAKGPERASRDLADRHASSRRRRNLAAAAAAADEFETGSTPMPMPMPTALSGSCAYPNQWTGGESCVEYRGAGWAEADMVASCAAQPGGGTLSVGSEASHYCPLPAGGRLAGWCVQRKGEMNGSVVEATSMALTGGMGCEAVGGACTSFAGGDAFIPDGACKKSNTVTEDEEGDRTGMDEMFQPPPSESSPSSSSASSWGGGGGGGDNNGGANTCQIAPGPAGAAHQAPFSSGYRTDCAGTPSESSPYQWPLRWTAEVEMKSLAFESDTITYLSQSRVWYRLDKNWKRMDNYRQKGVVPFFSRSTEDDDFVDRTERNTMIHRGGKMYFITYHNNTASSTSTSTSIGTTAANPNDDVANIKTCSWLDLAIVGNIRPDWFLDARGGATDAQYLGNQHVYYPGAAGSTAIDGNGNLETLTEASPRLVKQWRKTDFANQYFTQSTKVHVGDDGVHWPLILNVPGEGFGDDLLQYYQNHELLDEDFTDPFLLDEAFIKAGGECTNMREGQEGGGGPPQMEYVPSNLEKDENAWVSNVWTGSPVWQGPARDNEGFAADDASAIVGDLATTDASPSTKVTSCYNDDAKAVELSITYSDLSPSSDGSLPWLGLSFRKDEECVMTPRDGSDAEVALVLTDEFGALVPTHFLMSPTTKSGGMNVSTGRNGAPSFLPLEEVEEYSDVSVSHSEKKDSVTLAFSKAVESAPEIMHLTYAIGLTSTFGYHTVRTCFDVENFPSCPSETKSTVAGTSIGDAPSFDSSSAYTTSLSALAVTTFAAVSSIFGLL